MPQIPAADSASHTERLAQVQAFVTAITQAQEAPVALETASVRKPTADEEEEPGEHVSQHAVPASVVHLPEGVTWPTSRASSSSTLFIRPAYKMLYTLATDFLAYADAVANLYQIHLTGSYGVGKRVFLDYVLYRLRRVAAPPVIVLDLEDFFGVVHTDGRVEAGTRGDSFHALLAQRSTFYLCESGAQERNGPLGGDDDAVHAKTIVVAPPVRECTQHLEVAHQSAMRLSMPQWSRAELEACRRACYPHVAHEQMTSLRALWGGVVRWTLVEAADDSRAQFKRCVAALTLGMAGELAVHHGFAATRSDVTPGHWLLHIAVESNNTFQASHTRLCSAAACGQLLDGISAHETVLAFIAKYRYALQARVVLDQVEKQFVSRLSIL